MPKCNLCTYEGDADSFEPSLSPYHDFKCPECGTTDINTSDINKEWADRGEKYGYGDENFLE